MLLVLLLLMRLLIISRVGLGLLLITELLTMVSTVTVILTGILGLGVLMMVKFTL